MAGGWEGGPDLAEMICILLDAKADLELRITSDDPSKYWYSFTPLDGAIEHQKHDIKILLDGTLQEDIQGAPSEDQRASELGGERHRRWAQEMEPKATAREGDRFPIVLSYKSEVERKMKYVYGRLVHVFGPNSTVHGLMVEKGSYWVALYFRWLSHAKIILIFLSPKYFLSEACRHEFWSACQTIPVHNQHRKVIFVVAHNEWEYPNEDPWLKEAKGDHMKKAFKPSPFAGDLRAPTLKEFKKFAKQELTSRNCCPNPDLGDFCNVEEFDSNMEGLVSQIKAYLADGVSSADEPTFVFVEDNRMWTDPTQSLHTNSPGSTPSLHTNSHGSILYRGRTR